MSIRVLEHTPAGLRRAVEALGERGYRADQIIDWVYAKACSDPQKMTNLPDALAGHITVLTSHVVARAASRDGTVKLLLELGDGERVECVGIPARQRVTACVSTQAGCAQGCTFCATGLDGLQRNLTAGEILEQVLNLTDAGGRRVTNVVFMGAGEPLANYDATVSAVRALIDSERFGISARSVTVSTVGLPGAIRRLAGEDLPITLAISLHAPNDALRRELMPAAPPLDDVLAAAATFYARRKREVTLEYVLLAGVNDSTLCAKGLARLAKRLRCNVNLIRYNPVAGVAYARPSEAAARAFLARLRRQGVNAHLRRSRGRDADAACGQLRRRPASHRQRT
ncbi:MAG: 23S rRNA (adenine(2503)-C(2))-methyltransferase RlmN [Phycisphaerae bacterium]|nr:23S rRNA (adenine(2503)-C(2))-methyltransferase RlmN [Phycisphaerae bacterium]